MPMPERSLEIKQQIGLVPDESMLFDHLTGGEFIEFVGRIYGLDRAMARAAPTNCWICSSWATCRRS